MTPQAPGTFRAWRQLRHQLIADLGLLERLAEHAGREALVAAARELYQRVEDRHFTLAVVGEFKRGKSTVLNALLGRAWLPADVAPATATLHRVTWGPKPALTLVYRDGRPPLDLPVDALAAHTTALDPEAAARAATVREAVLQLPSPLCRNDVDLLDTPGLSDEAGLTATTLGALPQVDAAMLVVMADSPWSQAEAALLGRLRDEGIGQIFVVVNALDRIRRPADRARVLDAVRAAVAKQGEAPVFGISALEALEAREAGDAARLEASGLPALEAAIEAMLTGADALALRRRLDQLLALGARLGEALDAPSTPAPSPDDALRRVRAEALIEALETLIERSRREILDQGARAAVAMEGTIAAWPEQTRRALSALIARDSAGRDYPNDYPARRAELAQALDGAIAQAATELARGVEAQLAQADASELDRLGRVGAFALGHLDSWLAALGAPPSPAPAPTEPAPPDPGALAAALSPGAARLDAVLDAPTLKADMDRYRARSGLDRLLALDLGGVHGRWVQLARAHVEALCDALWSARTPAALASAHLDGLVATRLARLDPLAEATRAARARLLAASDRAAALADRAAATRERDRADLDAALARARAAAAALDLR